MKPKLRDEPVSEGRDSRSYMTANVFDHPDGDTTAKSASDSRTSERQIRRGEVGVGGSHEWSKRRWRVLSTSMSIIRGTGWRRGSNQPSAILRVQTDQHRHPYRAAASSIPEYGQHAKITATLSRNISAKIEYHLRYNDINFELSFCKNSRLKSTINTFISPIYI